IGQKIVGTYHLAKALQKVQIKLKKEGLGLKLFDAYRPQQAVDDFIQWSKISSDTLAKEKYYPNIPKDSLFNYGYIASKSGHSRGSTIDLTLIYLFGEKRGQELDMGGYWDYFGKNSNYNFDLLSKKQKDNRRKLRNTMILNGFLPYEKEWWHFTLKNEPFSDKYFDFTP
ncbi:MAG: M15 family metallopeptidase, partial [Flavobacteriaceae bacterium]